MNTINYFKNNQKRILLDVTSDVFYETDLLKDKMDLGEVYVEFFSDAAGTIPVTPTAGTVTVQASPLGNSYLDASNMGTIDATTVGAEESTYTPPQVDGLIRKARVKFEGVTGALTARVVLFKH